MKCDNKYKNDVMKCDNKYKNDVIKCDVIITVNEMTISNDDVT